MIFVDGRVQVALRREKAYRLPGKYDGIRQIGWERQEAGEGARISGASYNVHNFLSCFLVVKEMVHGTSGTRVMMEDPLRDTISLVGQGLYGKIGQSGTNSRNLGRRYLVVLQRGDNFLSASTLLVVCAKEHVQDLVRTHSQDTKRNKVRQGAEKPRLYCTASIGHIHSTKDSHVSSNPATHRSHCDGLGNDGSR